MKSNLKAKEDEETSFLRVIYEKHWTPDFTLISEHISDVIVRCWIPGESVVIPILHKNKNCKKKKNLTNTTL